MQEARLEKWAVIYEDMLQGVVYGHPRLKDGEHIHTSTVQGQTKDQKVRTRNTDYTLGEVSPAYEKLFPGARERLFASLPLAEEDAQA